jgi:hypothetical protein
MTEQTDLESAFASEMPNPADTRRPALVRLVADVRGELATLMDGFESREAVLRWSQRLSVRTLGEIPQSFYQRLSRQFIPARSAGRDAPQERAAISALLAEQARERDIEAAKARELRRDLAAQYIIPASHRAFRGLRKDAGEYIGEGEGAAHDPLAQSHIAMRPSLDELDARQATALMQLLGGFESREEILDWGEQLDLATHGELEERVARRFYTERSTARTLLGESDAAAWGREILAAHHLIPTYNRGVRVLAGRAGEEAHEEHTEPERTIA